MTDAEQVKREICEMGRRIYLKGFAAANEGNLSVRIDDDKILCTPTMHSKGFLGPDDLCTVDMQGRQIAGTRKRTSEIHLHLEIYRHRPDVRAVVHCHPPHATAFAIAREPIPQCVHPEAEMFLGEVPLVPYVTPGGKAFAESVVPFLESSRVLVLANHGTVSIDQSIERAYWWTEILDAYCRILLLTRSLAGIHYLSPAQMRELLEVKKQWGIDDPRHGEGTSDADLGSNAQYRSAWSRMHAVRRAFPPAENHRD